MTNNRVLANTRVLTTGVLVGLAVLAAGGCKTADAATARHEDQRQTHLHQIDRIELDLDSGDITLAPGGAGQVTVERKLTWDSAKQTVSERWSGDTLRITTHCARGERNCATDYRIEVPQDVTVVAKTAAGDVTTRRIHGSQELRSGAGDLRVEDGKGRLTLHTDSGRITGTALETGLLDAVTDAGDISLALTAVPDSLTARSSAGDIDLQVPRAGSGNQGYTVQANTNAGTRRVDVDTSAAGTRRIAATTDSGNVQVRYAS